MVSLDNKYNYKSGKAKVWKAVVEIDKVTIWFLLENGTIMREYYRLSKADDKAKLHAAVEALLGSTGPDFDTNALIGLPCYVRIEERPWKEDKTWICVVEVLHRSEEAETNSFDNAPLNNHSYNSFEDVLKSVCSDDQRSRGIFTPKINTPKL